MEIEQLFAMSFEPVVVHSGNPQVAVGAMVLDVRFDDVLIALFDLDRIDDLAFKTAWCIVVMGCRDSHVVVR